MISGCLYKILGYNTWVLKLIFEILSKEKIILVIFLIFSLVLILMKGYFISTEVLGSASEKIASPLPLTTPIPTLTPTPTLVPSPTPTKILLPTSTPIPTSTPTPDPKSPDNASVWESIAKCETNGNWSENTGNGYFGGLQFSQGAWNSVGGTGNPASASKDEQITRGKMLEKMRGWGVWGACASKLGLN